MIMTGERNVHIQLVVQVTSCATCYAGRLWSHSLLCWSRTACCAGRPGHAQLVMQVASGHAQLVEQVISRTACCTGRLWSRRICCAMLLSLSTGPPSANGGFGSPAGCDLLIARHSGTVGASWNFLCKF